MLKSFKHFYVSHTLLKNFSVLTLSNILTQFLAIFISIKLARSLNPHYFGIYNLLFLHVTMFTIISSLGLRNIIIQRIARNTKSINKIFHNSFIIRSISVSICIVIYVLFNFFYIKFDFILLALVIFGILSSVYYDLFESLSFGLEKMEFSGVINLVNYIIWFTIIIILPENYITIHVIFGLFVLLNLIKTIIYYFSLYKNKIIKSISLTQFNGKKIVALSKEAFPYYYLAIFTLLSNQVPLLFLEYRSGVEQIGFFNLANKILLPLNLVVNTALAAIFPFLSKLFVSNINLFLNRVKSIFILISLLGVLGALIASLFREEIILLLYGNEYITSSLVLTYQSWYVAIYSVICLMGTILGSINKQKELAYLSIICTIIQVPILWIGAKYGAIYLSAAFLLATAIIFLIHVFIIKWYLKNGISTYFYIKISSILILGIFISIYFPHDLYIIYKLIIIGFLVVLTGYVMFRKYKNDFKKFNSLN